MQSKKCNEPNVVSGCLQKAAKLSFTFIKHFGSTLCRDHLLNCKLEKSGNLCSMNIVHMWTPYCGDCTLVGELIERLVEEKTCGGE